ncbi:response regulator [Phormidium sp. LEGE 05292]|uniref:sensor histidine kinase n=1 Tax=[Phormidium] sp. LEGE 05292 TaxID=767427 RepID=UPI00188173AD|nr:response regulator [Phormidium sp. LEGE 05292]MBE9229156.1 response regulator [Phormidium sp. LEGE 05292]
MKHKSENANFNEDILIVDDTPDNLRLLSAMLTKKGFEVRKALNGRSAIASAQADTPDLILLDIKMPEMEGYEVCQHLKADPKTRDIPVIFISALDDVMDKVRAFASGGIDYVTKPFQEAEVLARIENQLKIQRLQKKLLQQNEELARSNRELEQFAYVVSHDLQQPLQVITGFAKIMMLQYQNSLNETALDYLNRIFDSGGRMQRLIQDLLAYAQVGTPNQTFELIDCNLILEQVRENLQTAIAEKNVNLDYHFLPKVIGNEIQLIQLFQNLISNAIKFTNSEVSPKIKISATKLDCKWCFEIHDNGIGIDSQNFEQIFEAFHRTPSAKEFPGTGIGLATCKKIVENHQGEIWVESELNVGTTFYFTLALENQG